MTTRRDALSQRTADTILGNKEAWTRRMFELAAQMRADGRPVHDLSLGNPSLEPPRAWIDAVHEVLADEPPGMHRYMTNAGFEDVRAFIAKREAQRYGLAFESADVTMTVGAAGGLNVLLRAVADPGDEVIVPAPYFSEYEHYCANAGATLVPIAGGEDFILDVPAIAAAVTERTRIVLINSPNNPTGVIYQDDEFERLAAALRDAASARATERPLYVVEDSPYRDLVYDGSAVPSMLAHYDDTVFLTSHSKDLGLAGERIGYMLISPRNQARDLLRRATPFCNRVLGFVNAPALMQRVLPRVLGREDGRVDVSVYARNCERMAAVLRELGFHLPPVRAGFFLFPRLPEGRFEGGDESSDIVLTERLREQRCVVVPGTAFGVPGHLRLAMCVDDAAVEGATAAFRQVCG